MPKNEKVIEVNNLTVRYPGMTHTAVEDVSFEVKRGSITTLIGPNGSGKTTIMQALLGLVEFTGEVMIFGRSLREVVERVGFVPQRFGFAVAFPMSVNEFVGMVVLEGKSDQREKRVKKVLNEVGVGKMTKRMLRELSGGQMQRVLVARALVAKPELLILDEPEAGVDVAGEQSLYDLLDKLAKERDMTVLVASHELDVVYTYADSVVCVNRKLVCSGKPYEVLNQEMFEKIYGRELKFYGHEHHK